MQHFSTKDMVVILIMSKLGFFHLKMAAISLIEKIEYEQNFEMKVISLIENNEYKQNFKMTVISFLKISNWLKISK